ncbi:MAG: DUF3800 domain-containing protein [Sedimentisphaerales bacterium]
MIIYLDESGDLGFDFTKQKTTKKFAITLLVCQSQNTAKEFQKAVRNTLKKKLNKRKTKRRTKTELKGTKTTVQIKKYFFRKLKRSDWEIYTVVLNKKRVHPELQTKTGKKKLYNFLARFILEKLPLRTIFTNVRLVIDKSKNREEIRDFNQYMENHLQALLPLNTGFDVDHLSSENNAGLQAVDLFCWGIFRKWEFRDYEWYNIYRSKIKYETEFLPEKYQ